ncbi:MAG: helix-turn-helix transcriptional regulator [Actinobacteria bacterium]|nr:helix-turn-helix transcriptional regulator [Actinomycetota bacterium]
MRQARRLSLGEVAAQTEISASFLSLVEKGRSDITLGRLTRLVDFYGISITDLLPSPDDEAPDIVRSDNARLLHSPDEGIDMYVLASGTDRAMMAMLLVIAPGAGLAEPGHHRGEEFVHVLEGRLRLEVEGSESRELAAGDSAYYQSGRRHVFRNASTSDSLRLICVDSPPAL